MNHQKKAPDHAGADSGLRLGGADSADCSTAVETFRAAILNAGFDFAPQYIDPGRVHRFPGIGKRSSNRSGWCLLFNDCRGGAFGDWASGFNDTWQAESVTPRTPAEQARFKREIEAARRAHEREQRQRHQQAAHEARRRWEAALPEMGTHRYLIDKSIQPHGVRTNGVDLLIPVRGVNGEWQSLQRIAPNGGKRFLPGGKISGGLYLIGKIDPAGKLLVCEGFATGATLREQTSHPVAVAFNAGNLQAVAVALRARFPEADLVICADNDRRTEGNPGVTKATEAALAVGARLAVPQFDDDEQGTDWNDWYLNRQGKREVVA